MSESQPQDDAGSETAKTIPERFQKPEKQATAKLLYSGGIEVRYRLSKTENNTGAKPIYVLFEDKDINHIPEPKVEAFLSKKDVADYFKDRKLMYAEHAEQVQELLEEFDIEVDFSEIVKEYEEEEK